MGRGTPAGHCFGLPLLQHRGASSGRESRPSPSGSRRSIERLDSATIGGIGGIRHDLHTLRRVVWPAREANENSEIVEAVDGGEEMVPRHQLVPAFHAHSADVVGPLGVGRDAVKPGAIGPENLASDAGVPVGAIIMWWGNPASLPYGFELCDGTAPKPGSLLGGTKPDLRGRFPRGVPSGGTTTQGGSDTIGVGFETGGTALQLEQIPSHAHTAGTLGTGGAGSHTHLFTSGCTQSTGSGQKVVLGTGTSIACPPTDSPGNHTHAVTGATGGIPGGTMEHTHKLTDSEIPILPSYQNLYFIIRVK